MPDRILVLKSMPQGGMVCEVANCGVVFEVGDEYVVREVRGVQCDVRCVPCARLGMPVKEPTS